ncbi:MAG: DNA-protecting protein DprA [Ruminococcaceae bacterium]|nr:DNA-protecting protein DprA [Oscillospiraceae bacterium]
MDKLVYAIWLSLCCSPGGSTFPSLLSKFTTPKEIFDAEISDISKAVGYRNSDRASLSEKSLDRAIEIYEFCKKHSVGIVSYFDENYPRLLKDISSPPVLLYYRGTLPDFDREFGVACVGTRAVSDYGRKSAFRISYDLASAGALIVSGMATGVDGICTAGALAAGGRTVAVLGSGIDVCYPPEHLKLAREIVKCGCVMTEYAPGTKPLKYNFPKRNRIISGLSRATIVFEGDEKSGTRYTARYAKEQKRAVYALPGNVGAKTSELPNALLKQGAKPCTAAEDVINGFSSEFPHALNPFKLKSRLAVDMMSVLREFGVSALCQSDDVFSPPRPKKRVQMTVEQVTAETVEINTPPETFDKAALQIYKNIPIEGGCDIESLVDEKYNLREIMKLLLKLEMGGFIMMLPGEKVARKTK